MERLLLPLLICCIFCGQASVQNSSEVSGYVKDQQGELLVNAMINVPLHKQFDNEI